MRRNLIGNKTMPKLAQSTVDAALSLYDQSTADTVRAAFHDRGIL